MVARVAHPVGAGLPPGIGREGRRFDGTEGAHDVDVVRQEPANQVGRHDMVAVETEEMREVRLGKEFPDEAVALRREARAARILEPGRAVGELGAPEAEEGQHRLRVNPGEARHRDQHAPRADGHARQPPD